MKSQATRFSLEVKIQKLFPNLCLLLRFAVQCFQMLFGQPGLFRPAESRV